MYKVGQLIKELTRLSEGGYVLKENEKAKIREIAESLDPNSRSILLSSLSNLGIDLDTTMRERPVNYSVKEWTEIADDCIESIRENRPPDWTNISILEDFFNRQDPIEDYNVLLEEDFTVAGELYRGGSGKYFDLLNYFEQETIANIYLTHYENKIGSIIAFERLANSADEINFFESLFGECLSRPRAIGFVSRMKSNGKDVLGEYRSESLGAHLLEIIIEDVEKRDYLWPRWTENRVYNPLLHVVYFLGVDKTEVSRIINGYSEASATILSAFEIFQIIYMKYDDDIATDRVLDRAREIRTGREIESYSRIVGQEGGLLLIEYFEAQGESMSLSDQERFGLPTR